MLFEKISYQDDFPINISIASIDEYPIHYHQDIEFVYVLKGEVTLKNGYCTYMLREGDIFTNAGHEVHSINAHDKDNVVALLQISTRYFSQYFPSLSNACYRTYTNKATTRKHDNLREKLLQILLQYSIKSFNYKNECIFLIIDIIKYLEKYFNLFAFENDVVINFESADPITIERISRIISYIYQHYSEKITLEDLAKMEHLSEFYISHIIKNFTGMNFRDFLCFARVEWSEIQLLDTNKKISQVARDVGFSTTAYYEKYFYKWFKRTPHDHRAYFKPLVKSELHPEVIFPVPANQTINLIKKTLSSLNSQKNSTSVVSSLKLELNVDRNEKSIAHIDCILDVQITPDDFGYMGYGLFTVLHELNPHTVSLLTHDSDIESSVIRLKKMLEESGFSVSLKPCCQLTQKASYGNDTLARPIYIFSRLLSAGDGCITFRLRDAFPSEHIISGQAGILTYCGIKKPAFYAYQALSFLKGDIICWGKHYCVVRKDTKGSPSYIILTLNYNDDIMNVCQKDSTSHQVKTVLNEFKDEIDLNIDLNLIPGNYTVMKYTISKSNSIFSYLSSVNFSDESGLIEDLGNLIPTSPFLEVFQEDVRTSFHMNFSIKGPGIQFAVVRLKEDYLLFKK